MVLVRVLLLSLATLGLLGCAGRGAPTLTGTPGRTATVSAEKTAAPTQTPPASATPSPAPTATQTQNPSPTLSPTATPEPFVRGRVLAQFANLHRGPGEVYDLLGNFGREMVVIVVGKNEAGDWLAVDLGFGQTGWLKAEAVEMEGGAEGLALLEAPPTPTPTPTPIPYLAAWVFTHAYGYNYIEVQIFDFIPGETVTVDVLRQNGILTARQKIVFQAGGENLVRFAPDKLKSGTTYIISAAGEKGSSAQTTILYP